jgi:hypothetical protein
MKRNRWNNRLVVIPSSHKVNKPFLVGTTAKLTVGRTLSVLKKQLPQSNSDELPPAA